MEIYQKTHANDLVEGGYFSITSYDGSSFEREFNQDDFLDSIVGIENDDDTVTIFRDSECLIKHSNNEEVDYAIIKKDFFDLILSDFFPYSVFEYLPWKSRAENLVFDIISPDGFSFFAYERNIKTIEEAEKIYTEELLPSYEYQGYYSTASRYKIPYNLLRLDCEFIIRERYEEDEEDEDENENNAIGDDGLASF